jgi:hypothetical protein
VEQTIDRPDMAPAADSVTANCSPGSTGATISRPNPLRETSRTRTGRGWPPTTAVAPPWALTRGSPRASSRVSSASAGASDPSVRTIRSYISTVKSNLPRRGVAGLCIQIEFTGRGGEGRRLKVALDDTFGR